MIKIPIYVSYGGNPKPKGFTSNKTGTEYLIELANYIIKHAGDAVVGIKTHTDNYGCVSYIIPYENDTNASWAHVVIEDVDITRPWEIVEYDGSESLVYLEPRVFDKYNRAIHTDAVVEDSATLEDDEVVQVEEQEVKISLTAVHDVIQNRSYSELAKVTGLNQSSFSHYRHGRSVRDNMDVSRLHALTKLYQAYHHTNSVDDYEIIESDIREEVKRLLAVRPRINHTRVNNRLKLIGETPIDKVTWARGTAATHNVEMTYTQYHYIKAVRDVLTKAVMIDEAKLYENLLHVLKSTGVPRYQLALRVSPHMTYIDRNLQRHRNGDGPVSEWSEELWQNIANAVYPDKPDNVKTLQQQVLRGVL